MREVRNRGSFSELLSEACGLSYDSCVPASFSTLPSGQPLASSSAPDPCDVALLSVSSPDLIRHRDSLRSNLVLCHAGTRRGRMTESAAPRTRMIQSSVDNWLILAGRSAIDAILLSWCLDLYRHEARRCSVRVYPEINAQKLRDFMVANSARKHELRWFCRKTTNSTTSAGHANHCKTSGMISG
jgi:hypothetical protein